MMISMDAYSFAFALGTAGLAAMTLLGVRHGHAPGPPSHGHGHHSTHVAGGSHTGGHSSHHQDHATHHHHAGASSRWTLFLSPRVWFTLLVGFGATGLLLQHHVSGVFQVAIALLG